AEVALAQLDRLAVRRAVAGAVPRIAIAMQRIGRRDAFLRDKALECRAPVQAIGLAGVGIARGLRALDLAGARRRPFRPGEQGASVQRHRHGEGLRLPRLAEHRALVVARNARHALRGALDGSVIHQTFSRYGSNASIDTFSAGSASSPHNSRASSTTV